MVISSFQYGITVKGLNNMMNKFLDWIFLTFGDRLCDKHDIGHGDFTEEYYCEIKIFNKLFRRDF
jgi:hypothetical protein